MNDSFPEKENYDKSSLNKLDTGLEYWRPEFRKEKQIEKRIETRIEKRMGKEKERRYKKEKTEKQWKGEFEGAILQEHQLTELGEAKTKDQWTKQNEHTESDEKDTKNLSSENCDRNIDQHGSISCISKSDIYGINCSKNNDIVMNGSGSDEYSNVKKEKKEREEKGEKGEKGEKKEKKEKEECREDRTIRSWIMQTENPELYKSLDELENESESNEVVKVIDFNNMDHETIMKLAAEDMFGSPLDKIQKRLYKKRAYCLFQNESDYDVSSITPRKKNSSLYYQKSVYDEKFQADCQTHDMNETPSIFEIRKNETHYSENLTRSSTEKRESCCVNKSTDSFSSDLSISPVKTNISIHQINENAQVSENEMKQFFDDNMESETPIKFPKRKTQEDLRQMKEKTKATPIAAEGLEMDWEWTARMENKEEIGMENETRKEEKQKTYIKEEKSIDLKPAVSINTAKEFSLYENDSLRKNKTGFSNGKGKMEEYNDFQINSETEKTSDTV